MKSLLIPAKNDSRAVGLVGAANEIVVVDGWIQISPYGEFPNVAGLQVLDREAATNMARDFGTVAARLANDFRGLPFYVGHPDDEETGNEYPDKKSYGWWKALEAREDGLYGKAKMSRAGNELIEEGHYMYVSPYWGMREIPSRPGAFRPEVLYSVGLTNNPQIPGSPVGRNEKTQNQNTMKKEDRDKLIAALGLKPEATDEEIIGAANARQSAVSAAEAAKATAETAKVTAESQVTAANTRVATAEENTRTERKARVDVLLTGAVNEGRITEAERPEWAGKFAADFDGTTTALSAKKKAVNTKARTPDMGSRRGEVSVPVDRITAINTAVTKHMKDTGETDRNRAFVACQAANPDLFKNDEPAE